MKLYAIFVARTFHHRRVQQFLRRGSGVYTHCLLRPLRTSLIQAARIRSRALRSVKRKSLCHANITVNLLLLPGRSPVTRDRTAVYNQPVSLQVNVLYTALKVAILEVFVPRLSTVTTLLFLIHDNQTFLALLVKLSNGRRGSLSRSEGNECLLLIPLEVGASCSACMAYCATPF